MTWGDGAVFDEAAHQRRILGWKHPGHRPRCTRSGMRQSRQDLVPCERRQYSIAARIAEQKAQKKDELNGADQSWHGVGSWKFVLDVRGVAGIGSTHFVYEKGIRIDRGGFRSSPPKQQHPLAPFN